MSKLDNEKKTALEKLFGKKEKKNPPTPGEINQVVKAQKDSTTNIGKLIHEVQDHQQKAAVGTRDLLSEIRNIKNIKKQRQKLTKEYIEHQKCDATLPPLRAQFVFDKTLLPSYSQTSTGEENKSPTAPLYRAMNETLEKAMPASTISDSSENSIPNSVGSKSSESTSYVPLYKSRVDRRYDRYARRWGFDDTKTKEENIDSITRTVDALQEQLDWKYPNDEEEIELEGAKKLVEILPNIITSLMPIKMEKIHNSQNGPLEIYPPLYHIKLK